MSIFRLFNSKKQLRRKISNLQFHNVGFHGDLYLINLIDYLIEQGVSNFIETGTNVATTLAYVAKKYPDISCISCEPDIEAYQHAINNTKNQKNAIIYNELSQEFLTILTEKHQDIFNEINLIWLDAHGYGFEWPLKEEVEFFSRNMRNSLLLIDDFEVPHLQEFGYDSSNEQICSHDYICSVIQEPYSLYYPNYTEKTSNHHPLRGWGLYVFDEAIKFDNSMGSFIIQK